MKNTRLIRKNTYLIFAAAGLMLLTFILGSGKASALDLPLDMVRGQSPHAGTSSGNTPYHNLILSHHGRVERIVLGVYAPADGDINFKLDIVSSQCEIRDITGYNTGRPYVIIETSGGHTIARVDGNNVCGWLNGRTLTIPASSVTANYRDTGKFGATLNIRWVSDGDVTGESNLRNRLAAAEGGLGSRFRFRVELTQPGKELGLIETSSSRINDTNNSMVHQDPSNRGYSNLYYPFGARCSENNIQTNQEVTVYDADNGLSFQGGGDNLYFYVGTVNQSTGRVTPLAASDYRRNASNQIIVTNSPGGTNSGISRNPASMHPNGYPIFTPRNYDNAGGSTTVQLRQMMPDIKYVLVVMHQHQGQFVYIGAPGDAIFGSPNFRCPEPAPALTPDVSLSLSTEVEAGTSVDATAQVTKPANTADATSNYRRIFWYERNSNDTYNLGTDATVAAGRDVNGSGTYINNSTTIPPTWTLNIPANSTERRVCTSLNLSGQAPAGTTLSGNPDTQCINIVRKPYVSVRNGDVNTTCNNGTIKAFWNSTVNNGSGTQLAVFAGNTVDQFVSAVGRTAPGPLKGLTFSNVGFPPYGTAFGGDVGDCSTNVVIPAGIPNSGNRTFATMQDAVNSPFYREGVLYIRGNLTIDGNFTYPAWTTLADMPYFKAAVTGNIYINSTATTINGVYAANGTIYTCTANGIPPVTVATISSSCLGSSLTVNGALEANSIKYLRLRGSTAAIGLPAETITYDPLIWLKAVKPSTVPVSGSTNFDAYTTMPPIL